jgi:hypothetical protein
MADVKMTKKDWFEELKGIVEASEYAQKDEAVAFIDAQIELLDNKAEKAKVRAAAKKAETDELKAVVASLLTEELQTADVIAAKIEDEDVSKQKVVSRLTALVKDGVAVKEQIKVEKDKKMAYKLA